MRVAGALAVLGFAACRYNFAEIDAGGEGGNALVDASSDFPYIAPAAGWTIAVFNDFSAMHTFNAIDFVDGAEMYSNQPNCMFIMRTPYPEALAVCAGRDLLELTATRYVAHHVGAVTTPNNNAIPDQLSSGVWADTLNAGNPLLVVSSTSDLGGDGSFGISTQWMSSSDHVQNNTRMTAWDAVGSFDALGTPELYLGTYQGVVRRSTGLNVFAGDTQALRVIGPDLWITRTITIDTDVRLIKVGSFTSGMYPELQLAQGAFIEIGEGDPPSPAVAWVLYERRELRAVNADGSFTTIAASSDPAYRWEAAVTPPVGHALATSPTIVYVLETNRTLDQDRILIFTGP